MVATHTYIAFFNVTYNIDKNAVKCRQKTRNTPKQQFNWKKFAVAVVEEQTGTICMMLCATLCCVPFLSFCSFAME